MLELMDVMRSRGGVWPAPWQIHRDSRPAFEAMLRQGLIEEIRHLSAPTYRLTTRGRHQLARWMR